MLRYLEELVDLRGGVVAPRVGLERLLLVQERLQRLNPRAVG